MHNPMLKISIPLLLPQGRVTDAILSCPGCFTTLCIDCQRHERYQNQYRAMFVMNCTIDATQRLRQPRAGQSGAGRLGEKAFGAGSGAAGGAAAGGSGGTAGSAGAGEFESFRPVACATCGAEVGVQDEDEVVHFFSVIPSQP